MKLSTYASVLATIASLVEAGPVARALPLVESVCPPFSIFLTPGSLLLVKLHKSN